MSIIQESARQPSIFVINLARRPDRLARISAQLSAMGLAFDRVEAIDAQTADPAWLAAQVASPGAFGPLSGAEQACMLSHFKALAQFLSSPGDASHAVILEDDALFTDARAWLSSLAGLPPSVGLLKLERERERVLLGRSVSLDGSGGRQIARLYSEHSGCAAYVVSRTAAAALLALDPIPCLPIDFLLFHPVVSPAFARLKPHQLTPAGVEQADRAHGDSDIGPTRVELTEKRIRPSGAAKLWQEGLSMVLQAQRLAAVAFQGARWTDIDFA